MLISEFKKTFIKELASTYPIDEIHSFLKLLLKHRLHFSSADIVLNATTEIEKDDLDFLLVASAELKKEKPIQYILGETEFYGLPVKVDENTLIPRPETEELVDWIIKEVKQTREKGKDTTLNILDIGTGSGCIAIALAKHISNTKVYGLDISKEALTIAEKNAQLNAVNVDFIVGNILEPKKISTGLDATTTFDIIVSNPPYIRIKEKEEIQNNVLKYEPHKALFVPDNEALIFYDRIADFAKNRLSENGLLFFEINQYLGLETQALLRKKKFVGIEIRQDLLENDRMIRVQLAPQIK